MTHGFDKDYWEQHWREAGGGLPPHPYLAESTAERAAGTALEAGCGEGAEALWLAGQGWQVTAVDLASEVLARAASRAETVGLAARVSWVEADLTTWQPGATYDLVSTHYAHPTIPQLDFYDRIAAWVAPGGTLLIVGHLHDGQGHGHHPPAEASVTADAVTARLDPATWDVVTATEQDRTVPRPGGRQATLRDVVVHATRRA